MKKYLLILAAAMLFGTTLPTMAQQRKGNVKTTGSKTTISIPMEGPAIVDNHLAFLGISLGGPAQQVKSKLIAKGMKVQRNEDGTNNIYLTASIEGVQSRIMIGVTAEKTVYALNLYDKKSYRLSQAKTRFNALITKLETIYGKGKYETNDNDYKKYHIRTDKGLVTLDLYNEDEMDGASDFYCISMSFSENS